MKKESLTGLSWDHDIVMHERKSRITAWRLVFIQFAIILALIISIVILLPLKSTVPYVFTVDKQTGEVAVGATVKDFVNSTELNDKYWVNKFLISHERYSYRLLQSDFDIVRLLAGEKVFASYGVRFDGPDSLEKKLADNIQILPTVLSISVTGSLATVRFETRVVDTRPGMGSTTKSQRYLALVRFEYKPQLGRKEAELIQNPLGFVVTGYQVDPELTDGSVK